jgi:hypothetical protein
MATPVVLADTTSPSPGNVPPVIVTVADVRVKASTSVSVTEVAICSSGRLSPAGHVILHDRRCRRPILRSGNGSAANRSPSPIEPVSDMLKRKSDNGEYRLAPQGTPA